MRIELPKYDALPPGIIPDRLVVERVLYEAELPILYTTRTSQKQLLLAYLAEDSQLGTVTILTPTTSRMIASLESGAVAVREALESSPSWMHWAGEIESKSWAVNLSEMPQDFLPRAETPLLPEHEPVLRTRAVGPRIVVGRMPASVVAFVADSTRKALKALLDFTLDARSDGRPTDEHRVLYDLPIQSLRFASFEISFALPDDGFFTADQVRSASEKLSMGLNWAAGTSQHELEAVDTAEKEVILRAALLLTPPSSGDITQVEVSGSWLSKGKVILTKDSRQRVRNALRQVDSERVFTIEGRLGEIDTDKFTFTLRSTSQGEDRSGSFSEDLLEEMIGFLTERVVVAGVERHGKLTVAAVGPAPPEDLLEISE